MSRPFTGHMSMLVRRGNNNTIGIDLVHVKGAENYPIQTNDLKGFTFSDISNEEYMFYLEGTASRARHIAYNSISWEKVTSSQFLYVVRQLRKMVEKQS